ncbi:retrovirus-related pol polyprotein from transposon TNT 1-94 [Tanacetum coccineum]|uniref:Retrovirus-related pol polyprotein from transposon TNT 1-94 n=1 Tax=Tanacetum coccineum TaxID=301880 RepID=A0ABQ5CER8_9ASTR
MQVNVQFLQQLQPEWSRFVTVVKQGQEIDTVSYHKLHKGKEIAKPVTPQSESVSEEDSDPEQARRDKRISKELGPSLLNTTPRYNNDSQSRQFGNQRTVTVAGARETVGSPVVQKTGIQCFNCKGFGHYARECRKPKRVKDYAYHKEKMMMCKQAEQGVPLQAEQADWLEDTDEEIDEQELKAPLQLHARFRRSHDTSDPANRFANGEETVTLEKERVIHSTSISRPQLKSYQVKEKNVENVFNSNHDACVSRYLKDVNARTKKPNVVPISASKPKRKANKSVATPHKKIVASDTTIQKQELTIRNCNEDQNQNRNGDSLRDVISLYMDHKSLLGQNIWMGLRLENDIVQLILFIVDSGCTKHMTGNLKLLCNFVEKFLGTVRFGNDQFAPILGYGDLIQGNVTIKRVYYVEGLNYNLFSVGHIRDADLEVAFRKSTCFVRDLQGNDLLTGNRGSDLYTISLQETTSSTPICFMAKASPTQAWLWHRRAFHLNFRLHHLLSKKAKV